MRTAISGSARSSMYTWHTPSRCLIIGMRDSRARRSISSLPPRGTMMSTYSRMLMSSPTAARSAVGTSWTAASGSAAAFRPARTQPAMARLDSRARLPAALGNRAYRVGQRRDLFDAARHLLDERGAERQAVDEGGVAAVGVRL